MTIPLAAGILIGTALALLVVAWFDPADPPRRWLERKKGDDDAVLRRTRE